MRVLAVVDGEHYPPVIEAALAALSARGDEVIACLLAGGVEKLPPGTLESIAGAPVRTSGDPRAALDQSLRELDIEAVVDLSDEPVLDYRKRHEFIAIALWHGVGYRGADFNFRPPPRPRLADRPSMAVIGTGKRTGKTAVAGFAARTLTAAGRRPAIVAMGRGGPPEPVVLRGDTIDITPQDLLEMANAGRHAASDYVEDALLGRVPTVGCRRCGGGLAGGVEISNVREGIATAAGIPGDLLLLEGSGSAIPPAHSDSTLLVVTASVPIEYLAGYLGPYRLLLADTVIVTMCEKPFGSPFQISSLASAIDGAYRARTAEEGPGPEVRVVRTVFRPEPTAPVEGADVFVATTAPEVAGAAITTHLENEHGCRVVGMSHSLSDRKKLERELDALEKGADILLCEIKAAGIDVATRRALATGMGVVYMDNVPMGVDGDDPAAAVLEAAELAAARFTPNR